MFAKTLMFAKNLSEDPHSLYNSPPEEAYMLGGLECSLPKKNVNEAFEGPYEAKLAASRAGRKIQPSGCMKDFVLY